MPPAAFAQEPAAADAEAIEALKAIGEPIFETNCSGCHLESGRGSMGPNLVGNDEVGDAPHVFHQITRGGDEMPPFGNKLTPEEVFAVGTYVRNSWGNAYGILSEENSKDE